LPSKRFLLVYRDGTRSHISTIERDDMLLSSKIRRINDFTYEYVYHPRTFTNFQALEPLKNELRPIQRVIRFLAGTFIFEIVVDGQLNRDYELLQTPAGLEIQLRTTGKLEGLSA
jgi:hypothetical protein